MTTTLEPPLASAASIVPPGTALDLTPIWTALAQLQMLEADLAARLIEHEEPLRAALVATLCGQNLILLGPLVPTPETIAAPSAGRGLATAPISARW